MAIQLEKENGKFNIYIQHFLIDSAADLQTLESEYNCHQGDKAELPDGSYYLRHSDDYQGEKWELAESSSGGSESSDLPPITSDDDGSFLVAQDGEWGKVGGYSVGESTKAIIAEQTVITEESGGSNVGEIRPGISDVQDGELFAVTFDGIRYDVEAITYTAGTDPVFILGEVDFDSGVLSFDNYPFVITGIINDLSCSLFTENAGTYTVKIESVEKTVTPSNDFKAAVRVSSVLEVHFDGQAGVTGTADVTWNTINNALIAGIRVVLKHVTTYQGTDYVTEHCATNTGINGNGYFVTFLTSGGGITAYASTKDDYPYIDGGITT